MSLTYNNTSVKSITYNGNTVKQVTMNGVVVWTGEKTIGNIKLGAYHVDTTYLYIGALTIASGVQSLTKANVYIYFNYRGTNRSITSSDLGQQITMTIEETGNKDWIATLTFTPTLLSDGTLYLQNTQFQVDSYAPGDLEIRVTTMTYTPAE